MKKTSDAETSRIKNRLPFPTRKIHPRRNLSFNMSYSSRNSFSSTLEKTENYSSSPKMSVKFTSLSAPLLGLPSLDFCNFITTNNALRDSANSYNTRNLTLLMSSQSASRALPMWPDGRKEIASICLSYSAPSSSVLDMMPIVSTALPLRKSQVKTKH